MLESLVTWVLNNYVGDYLENLNTDQLSIALLSGQVELENVPLKTSALRKLDLPLTVRSGVLGKLTLSVPVTRVRSEPWTLRLSDVLVLLGPEGNSKYDAEVEEAADKARKQAQLDELERLHHSELASAMGLPINGDEDNSWWGASLLSTVLNNIQLIVTNVHIRYEDPSSIYGRSFCAGIRIQNVVVQTTNHRWKQGFVEPVEGANVFKKLELKGFSFYWNSGETISQRITCVKEIQALLSPENLGTNSYVIAPCCLEMRMEKNTSKLPLKEKMPRFKLLIRPEVIAVELSSVQMSDMRALTREWSRFERSRTHKKWRPIVDIHGNTKEWWMFAKNRIVAEGRLDSFRRTWSFALSRAQHLNVYARAYKRRLLSLIHNSIPSSNGDVDEKDKHKPSEEDKTIMRQIERDAQYSFNELSIIRDVVFARLVRENRLDNGIDGDGEGEITFENINRDEISQGDYQQQHSNNANNGGGGWYSYMTSFFSSEVNESESDDKKYDFGPIDLGELRRELPQDLKEMEKQVDKEILEVLHDSWDDSTLLRKDFLLADVAMKIDHITLRLTDSNGVSSSPSSSSSSSSSSPSSTTKGGRVLAIDLIGVSSQLDLSPRTHSISLSLSVDDMSVQRLLLSPTTPSGDDEDASLMYSLAEYTRILFAMGKSTRSDLTDTSPLFRLFYRRRSVKIVRHTLEASFRPLSGMYDKDALSGLIELFSDKEISEEVEEDEEMKRRRRRNMKTNTHIYASIRFPSVKMELRKSGGLIGIDEEGEESHSIASIQVDDMNVIVESKEDDLTQTRLSIGHIELEDDLEGTAHPLFTTGKNGLSRSSDTHTSSLSSSWPQLHHTHEDDSILSSSLPHSNTNNTMKNVERIDRKTSTVYGGVNGSIDNGERNEMSILCTLVGENHPLFESTYEKKNVLVDVDLNRVEVGMNRRTWTALMEMMGIIGKENQKKKYQDDNDDGVINNTLHTNGSSMIVRMNMSSLYIHMEYPSGGYRLGSLVFNDMKLLTKLEDNGEDNESMGIESSFSSLSISDRSPSHSILYDTRLILSGGSPTRVKIIKYGDGHRDECDMRVGIETGDGSTLTYVHTHRYLCALMDFWCQFAELQDIVNKSKQENVDGGRARILLNIKMDCKSNIILPRSYQCEKGIVLTANGITMSNQLNRSSELSDLLDELCLEREDEEGIDCLLDRATLNLYSLSIHEAYRRDKNTVLKTDDTHSTILDVSTFYIEVNNMNLFSNPLDISVTALRNLSNEQSHAIPDMSFLMTMRRFKWEMSSRFFCLLRGFLELNLGEPLIPSPDTIPIEILNKPDMSVEVGSDKRYATLSVRIQLEEVVAECSIGIGSIHSSISSPLCTIHFVQARLSFDASTDGQAEIDLICERATVFDRREVSIRDECGPVLSPLDTSSTKLMGEAHLMLRKDESPLLTIVLVNARILVLPDLLNDIKDFILISPHSSPSPPDSSRNGSNGVIGRSIQPPIIVPQGPPNYIKVTIRDSELLFLESPFDKDSLSLIAHTTTVLQMTEQGGNINATLEIQGISFSWSQMRNQWKRSVFSNEFSSSLSVIMARDLNENRGLPLLIQPRIMIDGEISGVICKLSHHDMGALRDISNGFSTYMTTKQKSLFIKPSDDGMAMGRLDIKCEEGHIWIQDELNGSSLPLIRLSLYNLRLDSESDRMKASLSLSTDFFNQRLFGWEPLIERWNILRFSSTKKDNNTSIELVGESKCTLDISMSEQFISQAMNIQHRLPSIKESLEQKVYRKGGVGGTAHHMAYVLKNSTQSHLTFTTAVEEILSSRSEQRKSSAKWMSVEPGSILHFEFPTILLFYSSSQREPPRQLIVRVKGWDESSPINVDASGTYFRVVKALESGIFNARIVIRVSMERDGRKQIEVCSSVRVINQLPYPVTLYEVGTKRKLGYADTSSRIFLPLRDAHLAFDAIPSINEKETVISNAARIIWSGVKEAGEIVHSIHCLSGITKGSTPLWMSSSIRRERYPEGDSLPGHSIHLLPPLTIQSLLPLDAQLIISGHSYILKAGKLLKITSVNIEKDMSMIIETDRISSPYPLSISPSQLSSSQDRLIQLQMNDESGRTLCVYVNARKSNGGSVSLSLWSPFWIMNKSGIPLIIKQDSSDIEAAGQGEEHEKANDKHALIFDLSDDRYPAKCCIRLGNHAARERGYHGVFCRGINLSPGVQSLQLHMTHDTLPTRYYNIGVEVRPGTGLYKDTQVVLLSSRYIINNASSYQIIACHYDLLENPSRHVTISSQSTLIWSENHSSSSLLCLKRLDASHWSCPFRIDTVHSNHVTMRAPDESPLFIRVEVTLHGAVFHVTLSDAHYYPPPIIIDNQSEVPVLYQQQSGHPNRSHLRTICKAKSKVEYAWDDYRDIHQLILQVYEMKSIVVDPSIQGKAATLTYDNAFFITLVNSFNGWNGGGSSERSELVLECLQKGKVVLNKENRVDGNSGYQLWRWKDDNCLENVGMSIRNKGVLVLDAIDNNRLMIAQRDTSRDKTQRWRHREDGRLVCDGGKRACVARVQSLEISLEDVNENNDDEVLSISRMRPGSGILHVHTMHLGPSLVIRIIDDEDSSSTMRPSLSSLSIPPLPSIDINVQMKSGIGLSLVSSGLEELMYGRLSGLVLYGRKNGDSMQVTASVDHIQIDNQLVSAEHTLVLSCRSECLMEGQNSHLALRPALKLEMNCTPFKHYDSFDVFRIRLCPLSLHLDELLIWKLVHLLISSRSTNSSYLHSPPDTNLTRPNATNARRCYFGTLDLQFGIADLSVVTVSRNSLPIQLRELKDQYNIKLISFEHANVTLPAFRQLHYFETSSFLIENIGNFYMTELRKQTMSIIVSLDAFGNPQGLASDLKDSFQGLFIEGDVQRFITGLGYGFSNSVSKIASSMSTGVGSLITDDEHEERRSRRWTSSDSALSHLYGGVKGLGVGVLGGMTAIFSNTLNESKKNGIIKGTLLGISTGAVDTVTKPVQGLCDLVEGTASAIKHVATPSSRRTEEEVRIRPPRVCRGLYGLLPSYSDTMGRAQLELLRINGYKKNEKLLDVEVCLEQITVDGLIIRHYVLLSCTQAYVCKQEGELSSVIQLLSYAKIKSVHPRPELPNTFASLEVTLESDSTRDHKVHVWCSRFEIARRLADKLQRAKYDYDHVKRSIRDVNESDEIDDIEDTRCNL